MAYPKQESEYFSYAARQQLVELSSRPATCIHQGYAHISLPKHTTGIGKN